MLLAFFQVAARSPSRRRALRALIVTHILTLSLFFLSDRPSPVLLGAVALVAGIVAGSLLIGWRLTQLPKSQALEFLLVTPTRQAGVFIAEALVGFTRLVFVTLAGLPILLLLLQQGVLWLDDLPALLLMPIAWGSAAGMLLAAWAYLPMWCRKIAERGLLFCILLYLIVGVLAAENLPAWIALLPTDLARWGMNAVRSFHHDNPFGVMKLVMELPAWWTLEKMLWSATWGAGLAGTCAVFCAWRLGAHFHDEHYRPVVRVTDRHRKPVGDDPLAWWAVRRVQRYAGRINVGLAMGFGGLYAAYLIAGDAWPAGLGHSVFNMFNAWGGPAMLATVLVMLATVPAAFQYGLWDSNGQDRCRRLELLLLTPLEGGAYWHAAWQAAWSRGRGYFATALLLWGAGMYAGNLDMLGSIAAVAAGVLVWAFYFALGFRAFIRGREANFLGLVLTLVVPVLTYLIAVRGGPMLAQCLPTGAMYYAAVQTPDVVWLVAPLIFGCAAWVVGRQARGEVIPALRGWYDANHGKAE